MQYTFTLIFAVLVAAIGCGFQVGFNIGVLNNPEKEIKGWVSEKTGAKDSTLSLYWGAIVSLNPFGGLIGGAITSVICNLFGRRGGLIVNNVVAIVGGILMGLAKSAGFVFLLMLGRFLIGINSGLNAGLGPVYICEVSPTKTRGAVECYILLIASLLIFLTPCPCEGQWIGCWEEIHWWTFGSLFQLNITLSILFAGLLGFEGVLGSEDMWPLLVALVAPIGIVQFIALFFCPESPRHYLEKKDDAENAEKVCKSLFGAEYQEQYTELKNDIADAKKLPSITVMDMFKEKKLRKPLILICVLMVAQQLSGINAVMFYSTEIFKMANFSQRSAQLSTIGIGVVNVLTTVVSVWLVEASGRKPLLLVAFAGMVAAMALLFVSLYFVEENDIMGYMSIAEVYLYVIFFAIGAGSIPWLLGPELFNTAARPLAVSFAVPVNWGCAFVVGLLFPSLQQIMGPAVFLIFIACNAGAFFFVWIFCPETKNKSIDVITAYFE